MVMSAMEAMLKLIKKLGKKTVGFSKQKISPSHVATAFRE
jgi:hypothetical protein